MYPSSSNYSKTTEDVKNSHCFSVPIAKPQLFQAIHFCINRLSGTKHPCSTQIWKAARPEDSNSDWWQRDGTKGFPRPEFYEHEKHVSTAAWPTVLFSCCSNTTSFITPSPAGGSLGGILVFSTNLYYDSALFINAAGFSTRLWVPWAKDSALFVSVSVPLAFKEAD